ncbi:nucleoside/nucleotide kinase family protein [Kribbella jiaozuonensis]|uniref:Nucleoside/nucleotide kinase family protein n=1 Tax=Kribbella jiaozuonensis TaxID=2575441 RepID=A0A4U3LIE6_9ACTN|nr:nucleoside/nucleotide kinase family protein [Kribbella jiaozuonensis]TKK75290.1 nucleoside/nucleotide kinase family protein [Kribbella jiaozuonensis]
MQTLDAAAAYDRAVELATRGRRQILGITGAPAAGKSTYAEQLAAKLSADGHQVALVPMDGYHLAQSVLEDLGLAGVKGAPHTFDGYGFVALLRRLKESPDEQIWAPRFDRSIEDSIAASIGIAPSVTLVVTEGNYLLLDESPWTGLRTLIDQCWYVEVAEGLRHARLEARHRSFGRSAEEAHERTYGSDERNAHLIAATAQAADAIIHP